MLYSILGTFVSFSDIIYTQNSTTQAWWGSIQRARRANARRILTRRLASSSATHRISPVRYRLSQRTPAAVPRRLTLIGAGRRSRQRLGSPEIASTVRTNSSSRRMLSCCIASADSYQLAHGFAPVSMVSRRGHVYTSGSGSS
ncbi:hypothetical protein BDN71DRAFT_1447230 [Pleurotus eryngii]|uniref:Uncharacterized protein n=1 Tax=Pleurotus eryngii TaxID=5323 RepID=A0A9P5ZXQ1_PLEER|nr:hypothetical protein BDN71DRAFT_1447230 [Pleurotus eryngii]